MAHEVVVSEYLNIVARPFPTVIHVKQYDGNYTRQLNFTMYNDDALWDIPSSVKQVVIQGTKPDGKGFSYTCTWSGNLVAAFLTQQMTTVFGNVFCDLVFFDSNKNRVASATFILCVSKSAVQHFNLTSIDDYQVDMTFDAIGDDGYVLFYVPDSWDDVKFSTTGYDISNEELGNEYESGHLVLTI